MKSRCPRDLLLLAGWMVIMGAVLALIVQFARGNAAALLGAMAMWFGGVIGISAYELCIAERPTTAETREELAEIGRERQRQMLWPVRLSTQLFPGLWIGYQANSPLSIAIFYLAIFELLGWINRCVPPAPDDGLRRGPHSEGLLRKAGHVLLSATVGVGIRYLLRS